MRLLRCDAIANPLGNNLLDPSIHRATSMDCRAFIHQLFIGVDIAEKDSTARLWFNVDVDMPKIGVTTFLWDSTGGNKTP